MAKPKMMKSERKALLTARAQWEGRQEPLYSFLKKMAGRVPEPWVGVVLGGNVELRWVVAHVGAMVLSMNAKNQLESYFFEFNVDAPAERTVDPEVENVIGDIEGLYSRRPKS